MSTDEDVVKDRSAHVKQAIRDAAAELFARRGFGATGIREIADKAGVDPALIIRHFGSKEGLFLRTMRMEGGLSGIINGPIDSLGRRMVAFLLSDEAEERLKGIYVALLRASDRPDVQEQLREGLFRTVITPVAERLEGPDAELRASLFAAQMGGLMGALWVTVDPSLRAAAPASLVELYGARLQGLLTPSG